MLTSRIVPDGDLTVATPLHDNTVLALLGLTSFLALLNLGNHTLKGLANILVESSACFCPATVEFLGQLAAIFSLDLTLFRSKI